MTAISLKIACSEATSTWREHWVHSLIRDIKVAYTHVLGGIFLKATESGLDWGVCGQLSAHFSCGLTEYYRGTNLGDDLKEGLLGTINQ